MIEGLFNSILPSIQHFHMLGYWAAFFAALLETALVVGLFLPGSTLLLLLGAWAAGGYLDFGDLLWFAIAGAVLGDNFNYWLGERYGQKWTRGGVWFLTPSHFEKAHRFFERHGAKSVFLGRFIPSVKEIAPFVAGTVQMRYRTFLFWNFLGAIGWGVQWVGGGYLFGQSLKLAETWMSRAGMVLVAVLIAWALLWLLQRFVVRKGRDAWRVAVSLIRSIKEALGRNAYVRRWVRRHPASIRFLAGRIDRTHFQGLPLTVLALAFTYVLALFAGIVEDVVTSDPIVAIDHATAQLVATFRAPAAIPPFVWITDLGQLPVVGVLLVIGALLLWLVNRKYAIVGLLVSSWGAVAFSALGKLAFERPRPTEAVLLETSYSFPSGHATIAVAFYGFVGYLLIRSVARWRTRVNLFFSTVGLVFLIGLSRIMLGAHYLSDVWAGYLVGALWLIVGISLTEWLSTGGRMDWDAPAEPRRKAAAFGLVAITAAGFVAYAATRTLPAPVSAPEVVIHVTQPLDEMLRAEKLTSTSSLFGTSEQPLSFAVVTPSEDALSALLSGAGWLPADSPDLKNLLRLAQQGLSYTTAPLAPALWNNRINDLAFERPIQNAQGKAVITVRLWQTPFRFGAEKVFVGVTRTYDGIRWGILHTVSPDVDAAAERFVESLKQSGRPLNLCQRSLTAPMTGSYLMGDRFFTRGQLWLLDPGGGTDAADLCGAHGSGQ
ncbi:MAG: phosphatase PAP2 family protein [Castellaniella sp.]|uniref:bifunctional DedA family/phosphatase PAP2 family protein n=1 Tax=Castellaniella sp. TaxID=1955812 RepID=UPI00120C82AA|nr:bifunctional DedA family/phosphatase PAP2 family protein [Castellaniella sp.]TAN25808.1 MAG: phosphatase PAP2 family protein [Castellaniella sp.]